jgi:hypothetical protein
MRARLRVATFMINLGPVELIAAHIELEQVVVRARRLAEIITTKKVGTISNDHKRVTGTPGRGITDTRRLLPLHLSGALHVRLSVKERIDEGSLETLSQLIE